MRTYRNRSIAPITAFLTLAAIAGPVHAQGASSGLHLGGIAPAMGVATQATYSLGDVIGKALASSSALKIANHMLDLDAAKVSLAKDSGGPRVSASATGMHYDQATLVKFGGTNILVQPQDMAVFGLDASLPIDLTGQIKAQTDVNRLQALSDRFTRDAVVNNLILTAETTYFSVLRALHQVAVAQASLTDAQTQQSLTSRQYQAGTGQRIDLLRANTQVASAQQNLLQAKNALSISRVNLNDLVGRPLNAPTDVQDVAGVTAGVTARSASTPGQDQVNSSPSYFATPISDVESIDIDKSIQSAVDSRPELRSDLVDIQAATKSIKLSRAGLEPSLTISALGTYYNKTSFEFLRQSTGELEATLSVPIFDSGITRDKIRVARVTADNTQTTYDAHKTDVAKQVRQAYLNLQNAAEQIGSANIALQQASAARQLAQTRYESGVGLYLEVTDAEAAQTAAETSQVNAVYDYLVARAQFENAIGAPNLNPTLPDKLITLPSALPPTPPDLPSIGQNTNPQPGNNTPAQ